MTEDETPTEPDLTGFPEVQHRIEDGKFVCPGDESSRCHQYPGCDHHERWPCGCEYVSHAECWIKPWIDAPFDLSDSHDESDGVSALRNEDFPDGDVSWVFEGDYVLFQYVDLPEGVPSE
ncbi:hypothetical protein M2390_003258 [Mycetocola sp. BIGb0189]|uniref:hypothetical protein n=1 Tax=Mycetocola sp. BIGb0189 TaxID=2940604 RepID=UPI002167278C|nr:hypothetical protein [Mycetocola sp. BIGb0189]MCS4278035.1 hypothetical protein [Mycetocola sp. BIGb0189]